MTTHSMKLKASPFSLIERGDKTVEARLYDKKRERVQLGDTIIFHLIDDTNQTIEVKVIGLLRYETFGDMFAHNDIRKFGGDDAEAMTEKMLTYYDHAEQDMHGVIGIEFAVVI